MPPINPFWAVLSSAVFDKQPIKIAKRKRKKIWGEGSREGERDRERERDRDRQTDRHRDTDRQRHRQTDRQRRKGGGGRRIGER